MANTSKKTTLMAIEPINGKDAYVIVVEDEKGDKTKNYYDVASGLKVKSSSTAKGPEGQDVTQDTSFSDYKEVNGIKFPHKMVVPMAGQNVELTTTSIKINEPLTDADFN